MSVTSLTRHENVAVITMVNAENKQNPAFANSLKANLELALQNDQYKALVLASSDPKNWSQGIDVDWLNDALANKRLDEVREFMRTMDDIFKLLLTFPMPVIASINGHAFGNGAILACACDFRLMRSDRGFFCFPEVDLSIPFLPGQLAFIRKAMPYHRMNEMMLTGRRVSGAQLEKDNVVEQAFASDEALHQGALAFAQTFDKKRGIFAEHKKRLHKHMLQVIDTENVAIIDALSLMV